MSDNNIKSIIDVTMDKLRALVDADIVTGSPIEVGELTLIPVSRVSFGMASGGSDFPSKSGQLFGGGGGAGVTVVPIAFMVVNGENVKMLPVYNEVTSLEKAITMAPEILEKAKGLFAKKEDKE
jgi:sporulation protein YtfJ